MSGSNGDGIPYPIPSPDHSNFLEELARRLEADGVVAFDPRDLAVWLAAIWGRHFTGEAELASGELAARDYRKGLDGHGEEG